jgi:hypothetical protein
MIKRRFARTNKRRYMSQLAAAEVRQRFMRRLALRLAANARLSRIRGRQRRRKKRAQAESDDLEADAIDSSDLTRRYNIADSTRENENILEWVYRNRSDIATKVVI